MFVVAETEEVGHDHMHTKSGRVPYIEILYHLQVQAKKPWRQFQRTNCVKIHANENSSAIPRPSSLPKENKIKLNVSHLCHSTWRRIP